MRVYQFRHRGKMILNNLFCGFWVVIFFVFVNFIYQFSGIFFNNVILVKFDLSVLSGEVLEILV